MRIYPINQSPIMFRGTQPAQHTTLKRYCEPRTGAYYYYDPAQLEKSQNHNVLKNIANKFTKMSKAIKDTFTQNNINNNGDDDILWL